MAQQIIGQIPEFTVDSSASPREGKQEEVKEPVAEEGTEEEKGTQEPPAEKPSEEKKEEIQVAPTVDTQVQVDTQETNKALRGLQEERVKLLKEISELKGQRREIKQEQIDKVEKQIDDLKDLHPDDIATIDRVLRAKGYLTKEESQTMFYEAVKQEEITKFLEKYPEYKPENDSNDLNWNSLQREMAYYRMPLNPHDLFQVLERAHRMVPRTRSDLGDIETKKHAISVASTGSGGSQKSSISKKLDSRYVDELRRGGFSEDDIKSMEARL